jgi:hypothetical protein
MADPLAESQLLQQQALAAAQTMTPEQRAQAQQNEIAGAAQAAARNAAYQNNTLPVLPVMGQSSLTQAEIADAAGEAKKHAMAFHPEEYYGVSIGSLANVPLSQIQSRYGTQFADIVQGYYTRNPTPGAAGIIAEYNARKGIVANPFGEGNAAAIAWDVSRQGGVVSSSLAGKSFGEGYVGNINVSSGMLSSSKLVATLPSGQTVTTYMPYGEYAQIKMPESKILMGFNTGELGVYQQPYGHSMYMLTGGASRNALQSGMFTIEKPETPYVVSQGDIGKYVLPAGTGLSRLGAEAYGGYVTPLTGTRLEPNEAFSVYGNIYNLANYVNPQGPNLGKAAAPGANIPWGVAENAPAMQYMDKNGVGNTGAW